MTERILRCCLLAPVLAVIAAAATACREQEPPPARTVLAHGFPIDKPKPRASDRFGQLQPSAAQPAASGQPAASPQPSATGSAPTDAYLMTYLTWYRDWKRLTNRHRGELEAASAALDARYSLRDTDKIAKDPELLALLERQRKEMKQHVATAPRGPTADALELGISGVAKLVFRPKEMTYVPGRDEAALAAARTRYGDKFVQWILEHEAIIVGTLSQ